MATDDQSGSGKTYVGAGDSYQQMIWDKSTRKVRLVAHADVNMDTDSCLDAYVDWENSTHYDARVVRVCRPGGTVETDPGGDGYWVEHEDWDDEPVPGMKIAAGYRIVDNLSVAVSTILFRVGTQPVHDPAPATASSWWSRTRTLYQDGHVESYAHEPYDCNIEKVYPWNCQGA